jgi:hypothetical protein
MKRIFGLLIAVTTLGTACSSTSAPTAASEAPESPTISATAPPVAPLVGRWERVTTCEEMVKALEEAGMGALAPVASAGNGLVPGSAKQLAQKTDICKGATARVHSHYFTEGGAFGSVDWNNQQVDDGSYEIVNDQALVIADTTFRYRIDGGDTLTLDPVIPAASRRAALAHPTEFSDAMWSVTVAMAGHTWKRVDCLAWC